MSIWTELLPCAIDELDVAGVPTRVLQAGPVDGRIVLLLHGRGGHLETFVRNIPAIVGSGYRVIAIDLLGHGLTAQRGERYNIGELLDHARNVRGAVAPGDHVLIGQSLGGWLAVLLAAERRPDGLILVEPAGFQNDEERLADPRVRAAFAEGGKAFDEATEQNVTRRFAQLLFASSSIDPEMVALRARLYALPGAGAVHKAVRTADNARWLLDVGLLASAGVPPLILRGEHGHIPPVLLETAAAAAGGRLVTIPAAKQWPHYENPTAVNAIITQYLKERAA